MLSRECAEISTAPARRGKQHTRFDPGMTISTSVPSLGSVSRAPNSILWVNLFVDFLVTKHGLDAILQPDSIGFDALHAYFLDRLVPVCAQLLAAAAEAGEISTDIDAYELMRGIGNLCVGADTDPRYNAHRMVVLLIAGLLHSRST